MESERDYYILPSANEEEWQKLSTMMEKDIPNLESLALLLNSLYCHKFPKRRHSTNFPALETAISDLESKFEDFNFFKRVLPFMQGLFLKLGSIFESKNHRIGMLRAVDHTEMTSLTGEENSCILCHGFFSTLVPFLSEG